jgi:hypothetical protein
MRVYSVRGRLSILSPVTVSQVRFRISGGGLGHGAVRGGGRENRLEFNLKATADGLTLGMSAGQTRSFAE